jgi:hypothetical protein
MFYDNHRCQRLSPLTGQNGFTLKYRLRDMKSSQIVYIDTTDDTEHLKNERNSAIIPLFGCKVEKLLTPIGYIRPIVKYLRIRL